MSSPRRLPFAVLCLLWAGILVGITFTETMKFHAPTLSRSVAFDVGRTIFHASQRLQVGLLIVALLAALVGEVPRWAWVFLAVVAGTLLLQVVWIFPILDARAQAIIAGGVPVGTSPHGFYALLEGLKVLALLLAAREVLVAPRQIQDA
jgi:hypothetical protein